MKKLIVLFLLCMLLILVPSNCVRADDDDWFNPLKLKSVWVDYKNFQAGARDPLFWDSSPNEELDLHVDNEVFKYGYWDSMVHSETDQYQYHVVGLNMHLGVHLFSWLDVGYEHYSQHILDNTYPYNRFPTENDVEIRIFFYQDKVTHDYLIP